MDLRLQGRSAIVTGAAGGIGGAVADALAREGARLTLLDRDEAALAIMAARIEACGSRPATVAVDVTDEAALRRAISTVAEHGLDVLVSCSGISGGIDTGVAATTAAQVRRVLDVNVVGTFTAISASLPALRQSDAAAIIVIASDSAHVAAPGMAAYGASKAALVQLARAVSVEEPSIRVVTLSPSVVDTTMSRNDLGRAGDGFSDADFPVHDPRDIAAQVAFLCSPRARGIDGTDVLADFGYSVRSGFPA